LADEFEKHSEKALEDPDLYLGNPVNAYLFVKHFTIDWDNEIDIVIKNNSRSGKLTSIVSLLKY
jgi:prolyl 4-hydroxylase